MQEDPIRRESRALIAAAKSVGCYLDFQIDQLVYKLYGLTEDEIAIVEGRGENESKSKVEVEECGDVGVKPRRRRGARGRSAVVGATALPDDDEELE